MRVTSTLVAAGLQQLATAAQPTTATAEVNADGSIVVPKLMSREEPDAAKDASLKPISTHRQDETAGDAAAASADAAEAGAAPADIADNPDVDVGVSFAQLSQEMQNVIGNLKKDQRFNVQEDGKVFIKLPGQNYSAYFHRKTTFYQLRLDMGTLDLTNKRVMAMIGDYTHTMVAGNSHQPEGHSWTKDPWGRAMCCRAENDPCGWSRLDLTGTPFTIPDGKHSFASFGWKPKVEVFCGSNADGLASAATEKNYVANSVHGLIHGFDEDNAAVGAGAGAGAGATRGLLDGLKDAGNELGNHLTGNNNNNNNNHNSNNNSGVGGIAAAGQGLIGAANGGQQQQQAPAGTGDNAPNQKLCRVNAGGHCGGAALHGDATNGSIGHGDSADAKFMLNIDDTSPFTGATTTPAPPPPQQAAPAKQPCGIKSGAGVRLGCEVDSVGSGGSSVYTDSRGSGLAAWVAVSVAAAVALGW